jgi:hypothetical protein
MEAFGREVPAAGDMTEGPKNDPDPNPEALARASRAGERNGTLSGEDQDSALAWFMDDQADNVTKVIEINIGIGDEKRWVPWTIKPVDNEILRTIRKQAEQASTRMQRRRGQAEIDQAQINLAIVAKGTVNPDLEVLAAQKMGRPDGLGQNPLPFVMAMLKDRFKHKPGLVDQIAGEVLALSGYDDEDLREPLAGKP